ncbi:MAG: glycosyltransferase 87 family protein [Acidimicrobiales bacterium]
MVARLSAVRADVVRRWGALGPWGSDAVLYALSAVFALGLATSSTQPAQWHWGYLALGPYVGAALASLGMARRRPRREVLSRVALLALVVMGSVAVPLGLEAHWRHTDSATAAAMAQPEVPVIERAGSSIIHGRDPYRSYVHDGHLVDAVKGVPAFESFFPYFPLMGVFGLPSAATHDRNVLTDARIVMSLMTLLVSGLAIGLLRASRRKKILVAQVMLALPTGALFLATGGDDMPILALALLGVAALQRRQSVTAAVALGLAAAMKLTAWPLALGSLLVVRDRADRRTWKVTAWIIASIVFVTVLPFAVKNPHAFMVNVFGFPLGLSGVTSPAASALPGHVLTTLWPPLGHVLAPVTMVVGGVVAGRYLRRHSPINLRQLLALLSVAYAVLICVATATRAGYVVYPLNFALWSWVCDERVVAPAPQRDAVAA